MRLIYLLFIFLSCKSPEQNVLSDPNIIFTITENHIIHYNEDSIEIDSLPSIILKEKMQYSKKEQEKFYVILKPSPKTKVGFMENIKERIKATNTYNLTYLNQDGRIISTVLAKDVILASVFIQHPDKVLLNNAPITRENLKIEIINSVKRNFSERKEDSIQNNDNNLINYVIIYSGSKGATYDFYVNIYHIVNEAIKELNKELNKSIKIKEEEPK